MSFTCGPTLTERPIMYLFRWLLLLVLIYSVIFNSSVRSRSPSLSHKSQPTVDDPVLSKIKKIARSYRKCLLDQLFFAKEIWHRFPTAIETCMAADKFWENLGVNQVKVSHEHFFFILPTSITSPCIAVRLNLRKDTHHIGLAPENALRSFLPQCEFHGAGDHDFVGFQSIGKFYKKITSYIEPPDYMWEIGFGQRFSMMADPDYPIMVKEKSLLEKYIKQPRIDYLWVHQGIAYDTVVMAAPNTFFHEYSILLEPLNVTVCQVMLESYLFSKKAFYDTMKPVRSQFRYVLASVLMRSHFVPIRSEYLEETKALKIFYMNMSDPYCVHNYLGDASCEGDQCQNDEFSWDDDNEDSYDY